MNTEFFFNEVGYRLVSQRLTAGTVSYNNLLVLLDGVELCLINDEGSILYQNKDIRV